MPNPATRGDGLRDFSLSLLLAVQAFTFFLGLPLGASHPFGRVFLDLWHLTFAVVCITAFTRHPVLRGAVLAGLGAIAAGPALDQVLGTQLGLSDQARDETIALVAFAFNGLVTALVARHVFGPGPVTGHRIRGAVLIYLNAAALFAIAYGVLEAHAPGAIAPTVAGPRPITLGARIAELSYFSLATITTTGYGDLAPVHPFARSLANMEAVFGTLFPATLLARLIALQTRQT